MGEGAGRPGAYDCSARRAIPPATGSNRRTLRELTPDGGRVVTRADVRCTAGVPVAPGGRREATGLERASFCDSWGAWDNLVERQGGLALPLTPTAPARRR
ncbi:MAG: hypothetical protein HOZ81_31570 [Streptomyces sp.]|nr:hypothetical protein [Streptomyces sp.]NUT30194.1 hypothetical protein [Streptomyces sp.]